MSDSEEFRTEEPDPFDALVTPAEVCGFIYRSHGEAGLRDLLEQSATLSRERVQDVAKELRSAGLRQAAGIAAEIAATKPPSDDMSFCPYMVEPYVSNPSNATNILHWQRGEERRKSDWELKRGKVKRA